MSDSRYFALRGEHGVDHAGNPEPLAHVGLSVVAPTAIPAPAGMEIADVPHVVSIEQADKLGDARARIVPGTRFIETADALLAGALLACGQYEEVDKPGKPELDRARKDTQAHVDAMNARDQQVAAGDLPAPDATDQPPVTGEEE
jgi:hypothetical protein